MSCFDAETLGLAEELLEVCRARQITLVTAESCTGGLIAATLTAIAGASDVVDGGLVTYSNAAKQRWLDVPAGTLLRFGAVSAETAAAMADGAIAAASAGLGLSATGVAGPGGGSPEKPVGVVYVGAALRGSTTAVRRLDLGPLDRAAIRRLTVIAALRLGLAQLMAAAPP